MIAAIGGLDEAGDLGEHQGVEEGGVDFIVGGGELEARAELAFPQVDCFEGGEFLMRIISFL